MADLKTEVKSMDVSNNAIKAELASVIKSVEFVSKSFDEFKNDIKLFRQEVAELKKHSSDTQGATRRLEKELQETKKQLLDLKQYSRRNNIELKGVPVVENEDLTSVLNKVGSCLNVQISAQDIDAVLRVPTKGLPNIVVKFLSRSPRDKVLLAAKKTRLNASMLGFQLDDPIYVNEHLCPENKVLLGKAIQAKRENNWKFAWVRDGRILMRKAENTKVLHVTCEDDLAKVA
ncbi:uncharacterized protein LOC144161646 [Haemaphysalis longicornis]